MPAFDSNIETVMRDLVPETNKKIVLHQCDIFFNLLLMSFSSSVGEQNICVVSKEYEMKSVFQRSLHYHWNPYADSWGMLSNLEQVKQKIHRRLATYIDLRVIYNICHFLPLLRCSFHRKGS